MAAVRKEGYVNDKTGNVKGNGREALGT